MNWRKFFTGAVENWPAKVLSIGLAIIIFIFHRMSTLEARFFSVPLDIENSGTMMPSDSYPRTIRVSIRGEANSIYHILEDDIEVYVDMENINTPGRYILPVQWRKKGTALGVEPLQISVDPMEIVFLLDHRISKLVPIAAGFRGQLDSGYSMAYYSLNPSQVIVDGPAERVDTISELFTEFIDLDRRRSNFTMNVDILQRDPLVVIRGSTTTEFTGMISRIIPVRNITGLPISISGVREGFTAELETGTAGIRLEGESQSAVDQFEAPPGFLTVDCSYLDEPGVYTVRIIAETAENVSLRIDPAEVRIRLSHMEEDDQP